MSPRVKILVWAASLIVAGGVVTAILLAYRGDLMRGIHGVESLPARVFPSSLGGVEYMLEGSGPTVLVSHGITGGIDQGVGLARTYLGPGYRLLLVSRFGYLGSAMPAEASAELQASVYRELLDHLGIERVFVLGNSAGGTSALRFAIAFPARCSGLILVSSNVPGASGSLPPRPAMAAVFGSSLVYWSAAKLFGGSMLAMFVPSSIRRQMSPADFAEIKRGILLSGMPISRRTRGVLFDMYVSNPSIEGPIPFEAIESPAILLHAEDDPSCLVAGARVLAERIPKGELHTFASGGHLLFGHEEEIRTLVRGFVGLQ